MLYTDVSREHFPSPPEGRHALRLSFSPRKEWSCRYIVPVLFSCTQKSNLEIATGKVTTIKLGNVVRIKEINVLTSTDDGTFANMAGTAAEAMTPGIIGMGTSKLASATGSIVDGRVEAVKMIRVRVKLKDTNELVEVQQEVTPNFTLKIGQEVVITQGSTPGNVWPD